IFNHASPFASLCTTRLQSLRAPRRFRAAISPPLCPFVPASLCPFWLRPTAALRLRRLGCGPFDVSTFGGSPCTGVRDLRDGLRQKCPQTMEQGRDALQGVVDFSVRRVSRKTESNAAVGDFARDAHRRQYVRGFQRSARTRRAGGGGDAVFRERDDDRLGLQ